MEKELRELAVCVMGVQTHRAAVRNGSCQPGQGSPGVRVGHSRIHNAVRVLSCK